MYDFDEKAIESIENSPCFPPEFYKDNNNNINNVDLYWNDKKDLDRERIIKYKESKYKKGLIIGSCNKVLTHLSFYHDSYIGELQGWGITYRKDVYFYKILTRWNTIVLVNKNDVKTEG